MRRARGGVVVWWCVLCNTVRYGRAGEQRESRGARDTVRLLPERLPCSHPHQVSALKYPSARGRML